MPVGYLAQIIARIFAVEVENSSSPNSTVSIVL